MGRKAVNAKKKKAAPPPAAKPAVTDEREALRRKIASAQEAAAELARHIGQVMLDHRCEDVLVLDVRGLSTVCDFFVIGTGTSDRQMRAVCEHIEDSARERGDRPYRVSGAEGSSWMVLDYVDVVAHLFDADHRRYYELETLWGDAKTIKLEDKQP